MFKFTIYILFLFLLTISCVERNDIAKPELRIDSTKFEALEIVEEVIQDTVITIDSVITESKENKAIRTSNLKLENVARATTKLKHTNALRQAIDLFNKSQSVNAYLDRSALSFNENFKSSIMIEENITQYTFKQLFDEGYLSGKFILCGMNTTSKGDIILEVIFKHKQDKIFNFWLNFIENKDIFVVKGVYVPDSQDEKTIRYYRRLYSIYLNDDKYGV